MRLNKVGAWLLELPARIPSTLVLLLLVVVGTLLIDFGPDDVASSLEVRLSSNLENLEVRPVRVLVGSALVAPGGSGLIFLMLLALCLGATELWLGHWRPLAVYFGVSAFATAVTAAWILYAVSSGLYDSEVTGTIDVGVSYGMLGLAFMLIARPPRWWQRALVAVAACYWLWTLAPWGFTVDDDFTDLGHLIAAATGTALAVGILLRRRLLPTPGDVPVQPHPVG